MRKISSHGRELGAFTLIELIVSMVVLTLLVVMVAQLISGAAAVTVGDRQHLDADSQARLTFDRLGTDIARMVRRPDVDYLFVKQTGNGVGANDKMFFYSEAPAFYDGDPAKLQERSSVALLGYRINAAFQLERLGKLLTWDGLPGAASAAAAATPGGVMFLTRPSAAVNPDPLSTLAGNWPTTIGTLSDSPPYSGSDTDYHVLAAQVFRLELCYLLKPVLLNSGVYQAAAYAGVPVANPTDRTNNLTATAPPAATDDAGSGYVAGSRWYDVPDSRGYQCINNTSGAAVWKTLGVQDVAGIVVAIAVLDPASTKILPTTSVTLNGAQVTTPNLSTLIGALADLPLANTAAANNTVPDLTLSPQRLMAEAWNNEIATPTFAQTAGIPAAAAAQVRIYQRCFPLNGD
jgi:hypothetical protein